MSIPHAAIKVGPIDTMILLRRNIVQLMTISVIMTNLYECVSAIVSAPGHVPI